MARKTFISYKYSEAQKLRDSILEELGEDATYYTGETADSPDLTDTTTENIKKKLTDMMYGTTVTIVVISPNILKSKWIDWEIEYCLKEISRKGRTSKTNGVVGVIQKVSGGYDWLVTVETQEDKCRTRIFKSSLLYEIINENRFNEKEPTYSCNQCKTYDQLTGSYISLIEEQKFLDDPNKYIENAYSKAEDYQNFNLVKSRK